MLRSSLLSGLLITTSAVAQISGTPCFENNVGALLSSWDDHLVTGIALGFTFPGPASVTTSTIEVSTNGFINLQPDPNMDSGCCAGTNALLLSGVARISPYWTDMLGNGGTTAGVFFNSFPAAPGVPARAVITWANVMEYGTSNMQMVQCQMLDNGNFTFAYGPANLVTQTWHTTVIGVSQANNLATANPVDFSTLLPPGVPYTSSNPTIHEEFPATGFDLQNTMIEFVRQTNGGYLLNRRVGCANMPSQIAFAEFTTFGMGCPLPLVIYEEFQPAMSDLNGTNLMFMPAGAGYLLMNGPANAYSDPTTAPGAVLHTLFDDSTVNNIALPFNFVHAAGTTNQISISSNGFIWLDGTNTNPRCCSGYASGFTTDPPSIAAIWNDLFPPGGGGIYTHVDTAGNFVVSWHGVPEYGNPGTLFTSQIALSPSGAIEIRTVQGVTAGHQSLTGYSAGNGSWSVIPPPLDLTAAATTTTLLTGGAPLMLNSFNGDLPQLGTVFDLEVSAIPNGSPFGIMFIGFTSFDPGIDLTAYGLPGCGQHVSADDLFIFPFAGPTAIFSAPIPSSSTLSGTTAFVQAAAFSPGINPAGYAISNGGRVVLGR